MLRKIGLAVPFVRSAALGRAGVNSIIRFGKWFLYGWVSGASAL